MSTNAINAHLRTSATGVALIQHFESLHDGDLTAVGLQPKLCPVGYWTEGWGHMMRGDDGKPLTWKAPYKLALGRSRIRTKADADRILLQEDLPPREALVRRLVRIRLTQGEFDALVSFEYNLGALSTTTLLKDLNAGRRVQAAEQLLRWVFGKDPKTGAKVKLPGLVRRRNAEHALFTGTDWTIHIK